MLPQIRERSVTGIQILDDMDLRELRANPILHSLPVYARKYRERILALSEIEDIELTETLLNRIAIRKKYKMRIMVESSFVEQLSTPRTMITERNIVSESAISEMKDGYVGAVETAGNLEDVVGNMVDIEIAGVTKLPDVGFRNLSLDEFFKRPIPIDTFNIAAASDVSMVLNVWDLYTLNPTVRAKLRNYAFLKGTLHVRIAVSGTPFHYGRLLASYQPRPLANANIIAHQINEVDPLWRPMFLSYLSQAPGAVTINVRDNQPVDIVCPYIAVKPMFRLFNTATTAISDVTSYEDISPAGSIFLYTLNQVKCVSPTPSTISVHIYAWMEDVSLGCSTATQVGITTESDERIVGPVERIASNAATVLSYFAKIPVIGNYALASSIAARGMASVAAIFGWSKPIMIAPPHLVKNVGYQNGAQVIGYDTNYKVCLDPKQELTIDNRIMGSGEDELTINYLAKIPSYVGTFSWNDDSNVMADPIFLAFVNPYLSTVYSGLFDAIQPTPLAYAARPFYNWRGTITYRFDIVCSQFHRGKLAFFYEPNTSQEALINADISTNKQYIKVIDIQETQTVEFCINWASPRDWQLRTLNSEIAGLSNLVNQTFTALSTGRTSNGYIGVVPFTTLQSPDDSDIDVNVYIHSTDLQVNLLTAENMPSKRAILAESGTISDVTCFDLNDSSADASMIALDHYGERPVSFRSLLKRYVSQNAIDYAVDANARKMYTYTAPIHPIITPAYGDVTNLYPSLYNYLRFAYVGVRGSMRYRFMYHGAIGGDVLSTFKVSLDVPGGSDVIGSSISLGYPVASLNGTVTLTPHTNSGLEVELPYYSSNLFSWSFNNNPVGDCVAGDMEPGWARRYIAYLTSNQSTPATRLSVEMATGEDFNLFRFQGSPYYSL